MKKVLMVTKNEYIRNEMVDNREYFEFDIEFGEAIDIIEEKDDYEIIIISADIDDYEMGYIRDYANKYRKNIIVLVDDINISRIIKLNKFGVKDFIFLPLNMKEINMRIKIVLMNSGKFEFGEITLNDSEMSLKYKNSVLYLSSREFAIISSLLCNENKIISREILFEIISNYESEAEFRIVNEYVYKLRKKLKKIQCDCIETIYGVGYRWKILC